MELSGVIALALVGLVTGTPYGYGIKSGALATAEAKAGSGAYGGPQPISLSIPSGAGYSGTFSKSSSSSFAASSSSSSSSSSSFSFNGAGHNEVPGIGCQSGGCKNSEIIAPSPLNDSNNGIQNGAFASGVAGAIAGASSLSQNNEKCSSGKCNLKGDLQGQFQSMLPSNNNDCASGQCNPSFLSNVPSKDGSHQQVSNNGDSYNQNSENKEKPVYEGSQSNCAYGKCDLNVKPNTKPSDNDYDIFIPLSPTSNSAVPKAQKPSAFLNTPSFGPACTSHNCNPADSYSSGDLPSSYNVPILGSNPSISNSASSSLPSPGSENLYPPSSSANFQPTAPSCTESNCGTSSSHAPKVPQQPSSCNGPYCASVNNDIFGSLNSQQFSTKKPTSIYNSYENNNKYNSVSPSTVSLKPDLSSQSVSASADSDVSSLNVQEPKHDTPNYSNGFGSVTGLANNNVHGTLSTQSDFGIPYSNNKLQPGYTQNGYGSAHVPAKTSGDSVKPAPYPTQITASLPTYQGVAHHIPSENLNAPKPSVIFSSPLSNHNVPQYAGSFGGPIGSANGNVGLGFPVSSLGSNTPHFSVNSPAKDAPVYTGGFGGPAGPVDASFPANTKLPPKQSTVSSSAHNSLSNSYGESTHASSQTESLSKPSVSLIPPAYNPPTNVQSAIPSLFNNDDKEKLPSYSGGFGGPKGLLKPNEYNLPTKSPSSLSSSYNPLPCTSNSCGTKDKNEATITKLDSSLNTALASASASANAKAYSGGFGGPPGLLRPFDDTKYTTAIHNGGIDDSTSGSSDIHVPASDFSSSYKPSNPSYNQQFGSQANAGSQAHAGAHASAVAFANAGSFGANQSIGKSGCKTGCESASNHENGNSFVHGNSQGTSGTGGAIAASQSIAGANAGSFAAGRSFASSSVSAHATAGVKGGYGK